jgi:hypothetical protein
VDHRGAVLRWMAAGLTLSCAEGEVRAHDGRLNVVRGYFDKDEQGWVSVVDRWVEGDDAAALVAGLTEAEVAGIARDGVRLDALRAFFAGEDAVALAEEARRLQDAQRSVAWRFAELNEGLALGRAGRREEALARLREVDALTLWHAVASLYGYRKDVPHWRALWAVTSWCRTELGRSYPGYEAEAVAGLEAAGLPREAWWPSDEGAA